MWFCYFRNKSCEAKDDETLFPQVCMIFESVCVCVPLVCSHRNSVELFLQQGARTPWRASWPTKTARQGGENVPAIVKLLIGCCGPLVCFMVVHVPDVVPGGV